MSTLSPKQQEIVDREKRILEVARRLIIEDGYHGLNMDRIAELLGISKGTIYNHFSCKEEIIIALANETAEVRRKFFGRAALFNGCPRFRMLAIGQADIQFFQQFNDHFEFERMLRIPSILAKTSEQRQAVMQMCEASCMMVVGGIVRDALARDDVQLPSGMSVEEMVFGLWSLHYGAQSIIASSDHLEQIGIRSPIEMIVVHTRKLLDGFGWKPLSTEFDEAKILEQIRAETDHE